MHKQASLRTPSASGPRSQFLGTSISKPHAKSSLKPVDLPVKSIQTNFGAKNNNKLKASGDFKPETMKPKYDLLDLIKRRLDSLKLLQMKSAILEAKFYEDLYLLECKYNKSFKPLKELRRKIVNGEHEPDDDECNLAGIGDVNLNELERERELSKDLLALSISNHTTRKGDFVKGIPEFWLNVFKRVGLISQMIEVHDEPILKHLYDLDIDLQDKKPYNFTLKFHFLPNEYFSDTVLTKTYEFKIELDYSDPFVFEAPETECSRGCKINWKKGKNVTKKGSENDSESERQASFFNYFYFVEIDGKNKNCLTCEEEAELGIDYEIGYTFKEKVIPRAILYYMGEISDENEQSDIENYDDDDDEEQDVNEKEFKNLNRI